MTVATVRLLAADPENYSRSTVTGDGSTVDFEVNDSPVVAASQKVYVDAVELAEGADYTFADALGLCSFTLAPADGAAIVITYRHTLLSDAALGELLTLEGNSDKLAAAQALDIMANSEALIAKKIKLLDLQTDGPAVAEALRKGAKNLRDQAALELENVVDGTLDVIEMVVDDFSARERIEAEWARGA